jgi:hypothetical protein
MSGEDMGGQACPYDDSNSNTGHLGVGIAGQIESVIAVAVLQSDVGIVLQKELHGLWPLEEHGHHEWGVPGALRFG